MSDIKFDCPSCYQHLVCEVEHGGNLIQCPTCHGELTIPRLAPTTTVSSEGQTNPEQSLLEALEGSGLTPAAAKQTLAQLQFIEIRAAVCMLRKWGISRQLALAGLEATMDPAAQQRRRLVREEAEKLLDQSFLKAGLGLLILVVGVGITLGSYEAASERGGTYIITWGAILGGCFWSVLGCAGIVDALNKRHHDIL